MLVLNRSYLPVHVTSARRAFALLFKRSAEAVAVTGAGVATFDVEAWLEADGAIAEADDDYVATVTRRVRVPRIVRLLGYDRLPRRRVRFSRRNVLARDHYRCQYCGVRLGAGDLTLDHVVPRAKGGRHAWTNVVACCRSCNRSKGRRSLAQAGMRLRRAPRMPAVSPVLGRRLCEHKYRSWRLFVRGPAELEEQE